MGGSARHVDLCCIHSVPDAAGHGSESLATQMKTGHHNKSEPSWELLIREDEEVIFWAR